MYSIRFSALLNELRKVDNRLYRDLYDSIFSYIYKDFETRPAKDAVKLLIASTIIIKLTEHIGGDGTNAMVNTIEHLIIEHSYDDDDDVVIEECFVSLTNKNNTFDDYGSAYSTVEELIADIISLDVPNATLNVLSSRVGIDNRENSKYSYIEFGSCCNSSLWRVGT